MSLELTAGWELARTAPGACQSPSDLRDLEWLPAQVPGTVAGALQTAGRYTPTPSLDASDWWYRVRFAAPQGESHLCFAGLATLADAWLNGRPIGSFENMFLSHEVPLEDALPADNVLHLRFRALSAALKERRPRPRWRTRLVAEQQLRFIRTTLIGRIPGWSPSPQPVGPWRGVSLRTSAAPHLSDLRLQTRLEGHTGVVELSATLAPGTPSFETAARLIVLGPAGESGAALSFSVESRRLTGTLRIPDAPLWWPHTHGQPALCEVLLGGKGESARLPLGRVGFRTLELNEPDGRFSLRVNGEPVFCRGACWTPASRFMLEAPLPELRRTLTDARDAGMNMLRVGGTMFYESEAFFDLCDELGILIWQDFMFANMDYPVDDARFAASVDGEATQVLTRLGNHPSLAVLCGGSEVEQQAAMVDQPRELWRSPLFAERLPRHCATLCPGVPYVPNSPSSPRAGDLPFRVDAGASHYYGVGAYLRPLEDARRADVSFASECLAFSNVPDEAAVDALLFNGEPPHHHPLWKAGVPRDSGAGWDFEDVRDHYAEQLFRLPMRGLRYEDPARYLELGRLATCEVMSRTLVEWRRHGSRCGGALIWFFRDLQPGAGWGLLDAGGKPKPAYHCLRRELAPVWVGLTDEGVNGLRVHLRNETSRAERLTLRLRTFRGEQPGLTAERAVELPPRSSQALDAEAILGHFTDLTHAYRFGPPAQDLVVAELEAADGALCGRAFHFPLGLPVTVVPDLGLSAAAERLPDGTLRLKVRSERLALGVSVGPLSEAERLSDDYFHLPPGGERTVLLRPDANAPARRTVKAINSTQQLKLALPS